MATLPHGRGFRTGPDGWIAQRESYDERRRHKDKQDKWVVTRTRTADCDADYWEIVRCDPTSGAFTVTLPSADDHEGDQVIVKNDSASATTITVATVLGQTIDGASTLSLSTARISYTLASNDSNWMII